MNEAAALEAEHIRHEYPDEVVLDDVSLRIEKGQILGVLGPNGAGKSTLLQILAGVLSPTAGRVRIHGKTPADDPLLLRHIGFLPAQLPLYGDLTTLEQLQFTAQLYRLPGAAIDARIADVMRDCLLDTVGRRRIGQLSKGYRQRVALAQTLLHEPDILLLDEPGEGLDPLQTRAFHALLHKLQPQTAIVLCSHNLGEVTALCSDVVILNKGRLLFSAAMTQLDEPLEQCFTRWIYA